jgi:ankyrin repeat protein
MVSKAAECSLAGQAELDAAVQKAVMGLHGAPLATNVLIHLRLKDGIGSYGAFEDPEVATAQAILPGEYNWFTVGVFQKGRYTFTFRGSSYARDDADYTDMVKILEGLTISRTTETVADGALLEAACADNLEGVTAALAKGAKIDATDSRGWTPLIYAAKLGHARTALYLIDHGADVNRRTFTDIGSTTLGFATEGNHIEVVEAMLKRRANINGRAKDGLTALCFAASQGQLEMAQFLISKGADVNMLGPKDEHGARSPLMCAACTGQIPLMELLLTSGAKVELTNEVGDTALMVVAKYDQPAALAWLTQHQANVNARGPRGHTALIYAAYNGRIKSLKLLLAAGADPSATATDSSNPDSSDRYGAIDVAAQQGHMEAVALIRAAQKASIQL